MKFDNTVAGSFNDTVWDGKLNLLDWNVTSSSLYTVFEDLNGADAGYAISKFSLDGVLKWSKFIKLGTDTEYA